MTVEGGLPEGQLWWRVEPAPAFEPGVAVTVLRVRLIRRSAPGGEAAVEPVTPPGEAPPEAEQQASGAGGQPKKTMEERR